MISKRRIAVLIAALFLGAGAGVAALGDTASTAPAETVEQPAAALETAAAAAETEARATSTEASAAHAMPEQRSSAFPPSADSEGPQMLPAMAAYLERRAAAIRLTGAQPPVFPPSADEEPYKPHPLIVAYFEQRADQARLTGAPAPVFPASADDLAGQPPVSAASGARPLEAFGRLYQRAVALFRPADDGGSASKSAE